MTTINAQMTLDPQLLNLMQQLDEQFRRGWYLHRVSVLLWAKNKLPLAYQMLMAQRLAKFVDQLPEDIALMVAGLGFETYKAAQEQQQMAQMDMVGATTTASKTTTGAISDGLGILNQLKQLGFGIANQIQLHEIRDKCAKDKNLMNTTWCSALMMTLAGTPTKAPTTTPSGVTTSTPSGTSAKDSNNMLIVLLLAVGALMVLSSSGSNAAPAPYYQQYRP